MVCEMQNKGNVCVWAYVRVSVCVINTVYETGSGT